MKTQLNRGSKRGSLARTAVTFGLPALLGAVTLFATDAGAVGFRLPNQDPEAIARGNAFSATADDPAAIYYNPAGITQLQGGNLDIGWYGVSGHTTFEGASGTSASTKSYFQSVPQVYFTYTPSNSDFSFGLGIYVPYGLSVDWGANPPFRNEAMKGSILYTTVNPILAYQINDQLSVGAGPTFNYSRATVAQGIGLVPSDELYVEGDDYDFSFTGGVLWKPIEELSFGINYRYQSEMNYSGHSEATPTPPFAGAVHGTTASVRFPQYVVGGVSWRPTEDWNLEVDVDWTDWHYCKQITFNDTAIGNFSLPLNYHSSFMYEFGVTRQLGKGWNASAGYFYSENSVPEQDFDPLIPDSNLNLWSLGLGHKGAWWDWSVSYTLAYNPGREVTSSGFGPTVSGTYRTINNAVNAAINLKF